MQPKQSLALRLQLCAALSCLIATSTPIANAAGDSSDALRAIELCKQGKAKEALPFFDIALKKAPGDAQLFYNRALAFQNLGETDKSIQDYSSCLRLAPLNAKAYYNRALAYMSKNDYSRAKRDLDRVTVIDRKNADAFLNRGNIFYAVEQYQNALKDFDKSIELSPSAQAYINKGNTEQRMGLHQQAAVDYGEAIKLDTKATKAIFERALLFLCLEKYPIAIKDANKYIELKSWKDEGSPYACFIKLFAAKLGKDRKAERSAIAELEAHSSGSEWSQTIASFLVGKKTDKQFLAIAGTNNDRLTEAYTYIAMKQYCEGKSKESQPNFSWVIQKGNKLFDEFTLSKAMIKKIK